MSRPDFASLFEGMNGWCTPAKADAIYDLVTRLAAERGRPLVVVEVGVFAGRSLVAFAAGLRDTTHGGFAVGVDPYCARAAVEGLTPDDAGRAWWEKLELTPFRAEAEGKLASRDLSRFAGVLRARSEDAALVFAPESVDVLHIDGNHSREASTRDVRTWLPRLAPGGALVLDDADWSSVAEARAAVAGSLRRSARGEDVGSCWEIYERERPGGGRT